MTKPTILQRQRDAAAALYGNLFPWTNFYEGARCDEIKAGQWDALALVQAFAASEARLIAMLAEPDIVEVADRAFYAAIHANDERDCDPIGESLAAVADALKGSDMEKYTWKKVFNFWRWHEKVSHAEAVSRANEWERSQS